MDARTRAGVMSPWGYAGIFLITAIAAGCTTTNDVTKGRGSDFSAVTQMSDEAVLSHLRKEEWLFQRVILQQGLEAEAINKSWRLYADQTQKPDEAKETDQAKRRELISKAPPQVRKAIIDSLESDSAVKGNLVHVAKFVLQQAAEFCGNRHPRIHSIQSGNILHFQSKEDQSPSSTLDEQIIQIPIEGRDLHPDCVDFKVVILGKTFRSIQHPEKYLRLEPPTRSNPDSALLILTNDYLKTLTSEDQLAIHAMVSQHDFLEENGKRAEKRAVSYATRTITFYSDRDYRTKVLSARVPTHDIEAFPLPDEEVEKIYGPLVSDNFYVVDLSIRNRNNVAKLVNTGMIVASGRAIVTKQEPVSPFPTLLLPWKWFGGSSEKEGKDKPEYTIPVSVVPRSATLMYAVLDDEEVEQPRAKFFRGLELVGAIASAVTAPYGGIAANQAANLFSGVFIPSARKALPDRWPGFKRNIVNNAMQDLLKIPANSVAGHKHLFFSKNKIDTLISDQSMFDLRYLDYYAGPFTNRRYEVPPMPELGSLIFLPTAGMIDYRQLRDKPQSGAPSTKVISLQFDNMDIPFEEVVESAEGQTRVILENLELDLKGQIDKLERIRSNVGQVTFDSTSLSYKQLEKVDKTIEEIITATEPTSEGHRDFVASLKAVKSFINTLQPPQDKKLSNLEQDLLTGGDHTLENLRRDKTRLSSVSSQILSGESQNEAVQAKLQTIAEHAKQSERALDLYRTLAEQVQRISDYVLTNEKDLKAKVAQKESNLRESVIRFQQDLAVVLKKRTDLAEAQKGKLLLMNSVQWTDLQKLGEKVLGQVSLSVTISGIGEVNSQSEGLASPGTCSNKFAYGAEVTLKVTSSILASWEGVCTGAGECKVVLGACPTLS